MLVYVGLCYTLTMDILLEKKNMNLELALNRLTLPQKSANIFLQYIFGRLIKLWFLEKKKSQKYNTFPFQSCHVHILRSIFLRSSISNSV